LAFPVTEFVRTPLYDLNNFLNKLRLSLSVRSKRGTERQSDGMQCVRIIDRTEGGCLKPMFLEC